MGGEDGRNCRGGAAKTRCACTKAGSDRAGDRGALQVDLGALRGASDGDGEITTRAIANVEEGLKSLRGETDRRSVGGAPHQE